MGLGDRMIVHTQSGTLPEMVRWSYTGAGTLRLGTDVTFLGWFIAPNGTIDLSGRTKVLGGVHAANIVIEPDSYGIFQGIANAPPVLSGIPVDSANVRQQWSFQPMATDPEGDILTWTLVGSPNGSLINPTTGNVSWTPDSVMVGNFDLRVCDGSGGRRR